MCINNLKYIPLDFIKAEVIGIGREVFENNPLLINPKSIFSGELLSKTIYKFKNLSIKIFENNNRIEFSGSLHTFYNNGIHNYNDFNFIAFKTALNELFLALKIKPINLRILHLEWGYNLLPPVCSDYILDVSIQQNSVNKTVGIDCPTDGKYIQFKHSTKILKIYNKGKQFKQPNEIFRIEIKQTNWSFYRSMGINTLQDFIDTDKAIFFNELLNQWDRLILYDIENSFDPKILQYQTSIYWDNLRKTKSNKSFKYHFDKLNALNQSKGLNTKDKIKSLILKKGNELQL